MLKVELHSHSADDPQDWIPYTSLQLIHRAAALGFDALAITLHDKQLDVTPLAPYAAERGIVLIPGIERAIQGKHVLLIGFRSGAEDVRTFDDIAALKRREPGVVIAPHPFFPSPSCLRGLIDRHETLFDAVEYNGMFTTSLDFNRAAVRWARLHGKPLVGNGDVHRLVQLGTTYSLVDAEPDPVSICEAIAGGKVRMEATPHSWPSACRIMLDLLAWNVVPKAWHATPSADVA